jgi:microcystin-dependent protein
MHQIDSDGHVNNLFVDEDANNAIAGTTLAASWLNSLQLELINILVLAGIDPSKADNDQLAEAFQLLGGSKDWADITNKPLTFPANWNDIADKPLGLSPTGLVIAMAGRIATGGILVVPAGYLECNGAELSRDTYDDLFFVCSTRFGAGNGTTTFNIPDLRGEFIRGWDNQRGVDHGRSMGSTQLDAFQDHQHYYYKTLHEGQHLDQSDALIKSGQILATTSNTTGRISTETRPRNVALVYCIKY